MAGRRDRSDRENRPFTRALGSAVAIVVAGACGVAEDEGLGGPVLELVALPAIQAESREDHPPFGRIADLEIGGDGAVYVLDGLNRTISAFDSVGVLLRTFGRRGQAPGELEQPIALFWGPEGHLWVADARNARLTVYDTAGGLVTTYRASGPPLFHPPAVGFDGNGVLNVVAIDLAGGGLENPGAMLLSLETGDGAVRVVAQSPLDFVQWPRIFEHRSANAVLLLPVPFSPEPQFGVDPRGGVWYGHGAAPSIRRVADAGDFDLAVGRELQALPVTASDQRSALAAPDLDELRAAVGDAGLAELEGLMPPVKPFFAGFFFDDQDRVWVVRTSDAVDGVDASVVDMDVYSSTGDWVGVASAALSVHPRPRVRDGLLVGVVRDEMGVESVARYRLRP